MTIRPRSAATGLAVLVVVTLGVIIAVPAQQDYTQKQDAVAQKQDALAQSQDLAGKVLAVCQQGGEAAAPLITIGACPLAQQVRSAPLTASAPRGMSADQVQEMINEAIARQRQPTQTPPLPPFLPGVSGQPGREVVVIPGPVQQPAPVIERIPSTADEQPSPMRERSPSRYTSPRLTQQRYAPSYRGQPYDRPLQSYQYDEARQPPVTVTQPPPVTVTQQPPQTVVQQAPQTVQAPAPPAPAQTVEQPQQAGTPLLNGVGGLLNGLGNGL